MADDVADMNTLSPMDGSDNNESHYEHDFSYDYCEYRNDSMSMASISVLVFAIMGLVCNGCLLFVILRRHYLRNLTNVLIVNLTVSDIILFVSTVPFFIEADLHPCWQFGPAACKIANALWTVSHSVCMFTLAALAVERYCAVTSRAGFRSKTCALLSIWILAALLTVPVLITAHMPYEGVCIGFANDIIFIRAYITCHVILTFVIPLVIIAIFYTRMARALVKDNPKANQVVEKSVNKGYRKRQRLAAIVLVLVLIFAFFWTPFHVWNLVAVYDGLGHIPWRIVYILFTLHYVLIYVYLFLNPLVVFFMSSSLRQELFSCCRRHDSRGKLEIIGDDSHSDISDVDLELQQPINN